MTKRAWLLLVCAICFSTRAGTNEFTAQIEQLSQGIQRHTLDNGLVCIIKEDWTVPLVSIQVWVGAGSAQEGEYLGGGLSHLIEHMIFKGTPTRKPADIARQIDDAGGTINASTSLDRTVFWVDMPAEHWPTGLDVLADAVTHASFPENEWRREKDVVRREMAMGNDNPDNVLSKLLWQTAYRVHPYRFPVIGREDIFNSLTRDDLISFFRSNYTPDNMIITVVGSINADSARTAVESRFSSIGGRTRSLPAQTTEPPQLSPRSARKTGAYNISRLEMVWHTVGLSHPDAPALDILSVIAGNGKSSRLEQKIKENKKLAFSVAAWSWTPKDAGLFGISAAFDPAKEDELIKAIEAEVASWRTNAAMCVDSDIVGSPLVGDRSEDGRAQARPLHSRYRNFNVVAGVADPGPASPKPATVVPFSGNSSFTAAEVEKARNKVIADTLLAFQTGHGQADTLASGEFYAGTPLYFDAYLKRLSGVTPESLTTAANRYLTDNNRTMAILSPVVTNESNSMHGNSNVAAIIARKRASYMGVGRPLAADSCRLGRPNSNSMTGETNTAPAEINIVKTVFPNGLTLLCRKDNRLPFVHICVAALGGLLLEDDKNNGITCLMAELLTRGTEKRTQEQIAGEVEGKSGSISSFSGMNSYGLQARCFSKDSELFMDILSDCWLAPVFPEEEIAKSKVIQNARIEQQHESPMFLAQEAMRQALFAGHPYRLNVEGTRASVLTVTREDLRLLHDKTAVGSNTVMAVFGDISAVKAGEIAEKFLGKMPSGGRQEWKKAGRGPLAPPDNGFNVGSPLVGDRSEAEEDGRAQARPLHSQALRRIELTAPREQTIVLAGFHGMAVADKRIDALDVLLQTLNGLSSDLMINVRDKRGLAYWTGAYHKAGIAGGQFAVYSGTRAEEAEQVRALIEKEIVRIGKKGIRADEFERARMQIISEGRQNRQDNGALARECALNELYGLGYAHGLETEKRLGQLAPDDARQAAAEIMRMEKMVEVIVRPEK